jgi:hypothetical protein
LAKSPTKKSLDVTSAHDDHDDDVTSAHDDHDDDDVTSAHDDHNDDVTLSAVNVTSAAVEPSAPPVEST